MMPNMDWYNSLSKPLLTPPDVVFSIVWPLLYFCIGLSLVLLWQKADNAERRIRPLILFVLQLGLNFLWSPVFFGAQNIGGALMVILLLLFVLTLTIKAFYQVNRLSAWLLIPYWFWVVFATYLNFEIWRFN